MLLRHASLVVLTALAACTPAAPAGAPPDATNPGPVGTPPNPAASAPEAPEQPGEQRGTMMKIADGVWAVTPDAQPNQRYCFFGPKATPALLVDGKKIFFAGKPGTIPPNVKGACLPFELTSARPAS